MTCVRNLWSSAWNLGEMEALGSATEEQLMRIKAVLNGGGGEMTKQDEISAILAESE